MNELKLQKRKIFMDGFLGFLVTTLLDAIIGMLVSVVLVLIFQHILIPFLYEIFTNTVSMTGVVKDIYTLDEIKSGNGFGIVALLIRILDKIRWLDTWLVLFGVRFALNYIVKGFCVKSSSLRVE